MEEEGEAPAKLAAENGDPAAMAGSPRGSGQIAVRPNGHKMAIWPLVSAPDFPEKSIPLFGPMLQALPVPVRELAVAVVVVVVVMARLAPSPVVAATTAGIVVVACLTVPRPVAAAAMVVVTTTR